MDKNSKPVVKLTDWRVRMGSLGFKCLIGRVGSGHPRLTEGKEVMTSQIINRDGSMVETLNTVYELIGPERDLTKVVDEVIDKHSSTFKKLKDSGD